MCREVDRTVAVQDATIDPVAQSDALKRFVERYNARTPRSKQLAQASRRILADRRGIAGFLPRTKELVYPIAAERAEGSHIWDVDGNEYLDFTMGFGTLLFGHRAPFITAAIERQLARGIHVGPQSPIAGEIAARICALTGAERATFTVTGSEAVMMALRLARAATGRDKVACFSGSYHGIYDDTLVTSTGDPSGRSAALVPGITKQTSERVMVLPYGEPQTLDVLRREASGLAAVLVEPIQSRHPALQPRRFLMELREITRSCGTVLIFDEVLTGFRVHPAGAKALLGVEPDLVTYGKVIGGGLPIGVVAGRTDLLDLVDGGFWRFGDDSKPSPFVTMTGGTYAKHPLTMAVARAVMSRLEAESPELQDRLTARTQRLCEGMNSVLREANVRIRAEHFGSLFTFVHWSRGRWVACFDRRADFDLFFYRLLEKGIYIWEQRVCFLSEAHDDEDAACLIDAVASSARELCTEGLLSDGA